MRPESQHRVSLVSFSTVALAMAVFGVPRAECQYTFAQIDFPAAFSTDAFGVNSPGEIVGLESGPGSPTSSGAHGFLLSQDTFTAIDAPDAFTTSSNGIN